MESCNEPSEWEFCGKSKGAAFSRFAIFNTNNNSLMFMMHFYLLCLKNETLTMFNRRLAHLFVVRTSHIIIYIENMLFNSNVLSLPFKKSRGV